MPLRLRRLTMAAQHEGKRHLTDLRSLLRFALLRLRRQRQLLAPWWPSCRCAFAAPPTLAAETLAIQEAMVVPIHPYHNMS